MISFNNLGNMGRLGNQMFQYAALKGIARFNNYDFMIPKSDSYKTDNYGLFECFEMLNSGALHGEQYNVQTLEINDFHFNANFYLTCPDNVNIQGYFQTEKYFKHIKNEILNDFTFKKDIIEKSEKIINNVDSEKIVVLHVRRGDPSFWWAYTNLEQHHPPCTKDYYLNALENFDDTYKVLVVSDLLEWCKEQPWLQGDKFVFSEASSEKFSDRSCVPYVDLCLMSMCDDVIIANSSLSWWGAWLNKNPNKKIIAPQRWFGPAYSHYNMEDLIPDTWIKI
jgi:hypothetical protein